MSLIEVAALDVALGVAGAAQAERAAVALADEATPDRRRSRTRPRCAGSWSGPAGGSPRSAMMFSMPAVDQPVEHAADLVLAGADAGQVGHRGEARLALDPLHQLDGLGARRAARAVGHRHERGRQLGQLADGPLQRLAAGVGLGREELEREQAAAARREQLARSSLGRSPALPMRPPMRSRCAAIVAASTVDGLALALGRLEHDVVADLLDDRAQAARAGAPAQAVAARSRAAPSSEKRRSTPSIFSSAWYSRTTASGGPVMIR